MDIMRRLRCAQARPQMVCLLYLAPLDTRRDAQLVLAWLSQTMGTPRIQIVCILIRADWFLIRAWCNEHGIRFARRCYLLGDVLAVYSCELCTQPPHHPLLSSRRAFAPSFLLVFPNGFVLGRRDASQLGLTTGASTCAAVTGARAWPSRPQHAVENSGGRDCFFWGGFPSHQTPRPSPPQSLQMLNKTPDLLHQMPDRNERFAIIYLCKWLHANKNAGFRLLVQISAKAGCFCWHGNALFLPLWCVDASVSIWAGTACRRLAECCPTRKSCTGAARGNDILWTQVAKFVQLSPFCFTCLEPAGAGGRIRTRAVVGARAGKFADIFQHIIARSERKWGVRSFSHFRRGQKAKSFGEARCVLGCSAKTSTFAVNHSTGSSVASDRSAAPWTCHRLGTGWQTDQRQTYVCPFLYFKSRS